VSASLAASAFAATTAAVVLFQLALALGAPWGSLAMGGALTGVYPPAMRAAAVAQAVLLAGFAAVVLARAGVAFPRLARPSRWPAWIVVAFMAVSVILNLITPSGGERLLWAPVTVVLFACSLRVALRRAPA
jgi:hypothetical protein